MDTQEILNNFNIPFTVTNEPYNGGISISKFNLNQQQLDVIEALLHRTFNLQCNDDIVIESSRSSLQLALNNDCPFNFIIHKNDNIYREPVVKRVSWEKDGTGKVLRLTLEFE